MAVLAQKKYVFYFSQATIIKTKSVVENQNYLSVNQDIIPAKGLQWNKENSQKLRKENNSVENEFGVQYAVTNK